MRIRFCTCVHLFMCSIAHSWQSNRYSLGSFPFFSFPLSVCSNVQTTIAERINNIHLAIMTDFGSHILLRNWCNPFHVLCTLSVNVVSFFLLFASLDALSYWSDRLCRDESWHNFVLFFSFIFLADFKSSNAVQCIFVRRRAVNRIQ